MTPIRMLVAALAVLAVAVPVASAASPPRDMHNWLAARQHQDLRSPDARDAAVRSPGHPSGHPGIPAPDPVVDDGGSSSDWTAIVLAAGLGVCAVSLVGLLASRRLPPRPRLSR